MMAAKKPWRKVLYEKQPYADNYTDKEMFLRDLRKNIDFKEVSLFEAFRGSLLLLQEFCAVIAFVLIYSSLVNEWVSSSFTLKWTSLITIVGFLYHLFKFSESVREKLGHGLRTVLTFVIFGQLFSPVLHTLTDTISTDTIYTTTFLMMLVHLIFFDYGVSAAIVSKSLSLSAADFASICLASRLSSAHQAFILITVAVEFFVLFPILRNELNEPFVMTSILFFGDAFYLYFIGYTVTILFLATVFLITVVCPILFVRYQAYKDNIYGPWDEAVVEDVDDLFFNKM